MVDDHLKLFQLATHGVDFDHPGHAAQLWHDFPIQQRTKLHGRMLFARNHEAIDRAEPARNRPEFRHSCLRRQRGLHAANALQHELSRKPDVRSIPKDDRDRRQAEARDTAQLDIARYAI